MAPEQWEEPRERNPELQDRLDEATELLRYVAQGVLTLGPGGVILFSNDRFADLVATPLDRVVGSHIQDFVFPEDAPALEAILSRRESAKAEIRLKKDGTTAVPVQLSAQQMKAGGVGRICVLVTDLTGQKRAEQAARESEERFHALADSIPQLAWITDALGRVSWCNRRWYEYTGTTLGEMQDQGCTRVQHPNHVSRVFAGFERCLKTGEPWEDTFPLRGPDGRFRWFLSRAVPVRGADGAILRWFGTNTDITERLEAGERVRQSEARFRVLYDAGIVGILCSDLERIYEANDVFLSMVGYTREDLEAGKLNWRILTPPEYLPLDDRKVEEVLTAGCCRPFEKEYFRKDGSRVPILIGVTLFDRAPFQAICFVLDLTERKQLERRIVEAEKWKSIGVLAGGIAHDFNNLLTRVMASAGLAQRLLPADHPAMELLDRIVTASDRAASLTRQIVAYAGKGQFFLESVNLSDLVRDMSGLIESPAFKEIDVFFSLEPALPALKADRNQLRELFKNLLLNAAEAIGDRPGWIGVTTGVQQLTQPYIRRHLEGSGVTPGTYLFLRVADNGCGMDEATRSRAFDPFFTTKFLGRGLGLAAVAGIVRGHKGAIELTTSAGKGCTFTVWLPPAAEVGPNAGSEARTSEATVRP